MEKTIKEWLMELEEPHKTQVLANYEKWNKRNEPRYLVSSLREAISHAFPWAESPEGQEYWFNFTKKQK